jgi:Tfp pilus assembly PilM family ATPase
MFQFLARNPSLGIEITASAVRLAALTVRGSTIAVDYTNTADLPAGTVFGGYASPNIRDASGLADVLRECLAGAPRLYRRTALALPDGVFRVQTLEFDELPAKPAERERLIRWRLEKSAAVDLSDTVLRFQVLKRPGNGYTAIACVAKQSVITQYESLLVELGLEPWNVGISSFHVLNLYFPFIRKKSPVFAIAHLMEDSFTTIVTEAGGTRFYRYKEVKRSGAVELKARFVRDIEDSLHFYTHMDRTQTSEVRHLYLSGESALLYDLCERLSTSTSLNVEVLSPADVIAHTGQAGTASAWLVVMAAALGAGSTL